MEAAKVIAVHLIITPEYLRHVRESHPEVIVYALRLDRGASAVWRIFSRHARARAA